MGARTLSISAVYGSALATVVADPTFHCSHCDCQQDIANFHKNSSKKRGHDSWCKTCVAKRNRKGDPAEDKIHVVSEHYPDMRYLGSKLVPLVIDVFKAVQDGKK